MKINEKPFVGVVFLFKKKLITDFRILILISFICWREAGLFGLSVF